MTRPDKYKVFFAVSDAAIMILAILCTLLVYGKLTSSITFDGIMQSGLFWIVSILTISILLFIFSVNNLYKVSVIITRSAHLTELLKSLWYFLFVILAASITMAHLEIQQLFLLVIIFSISTLLLSYIVRIELLRRFFLLLKNKQFRKNILIVGNGEPGRMLATKIAFENPLGINIVGFLDDEKRIGEEVIKNKRILGEIADVKEIVKREKIDEILIVKETNDYEELMRLIDLCQETNINIKITSDLFNIIPQRTFTEKYYNLPVINMSPNYSSRSLLQFKRSFDIISAALGLLILAPFLAFIAILIKITSEGPVIIKQKRIGKDGIPFTFYKFRSMYVAKDDDMERKAEMIKFMKGEGKDGANKKVINKKRITPIGRILRKLSLDELPQLYNVLKGEMSLVGPRPCLPYEYENYDNWQKRRFNVIPGCTGVWQVMGRSSVSFNDSIILDLYYINNMSPWLDLQLVIKTLPVMIFERGGE